MATNSGNGGVWNESDHPRDSDGKFTDAGGGTGPAPTAKTKAVSDKVKKRRADGITIRDPSVSMRVPDSELCKGDVEADEIRLPKSTDKPDEDVHTLSEAEQLSHLYGKEYKGLKGTAAIKKLLMERKGHVKDAAHTTLVINGKPTEISVDYVWGNDKAGLKHLIASRTDELKKRTPEQIRQHIATLLNNITEAIETGEYAGEGKHKGDIVIDCRPLKTTVVIGRSYKNQKATYVLTGYKKDE